ncbi:MAG TPA: two-component sensor histidine kinase, partial [Clostridiaceae bacterium]|nr:two-component sensor histidine kinase [Clostridiaceae bacterium]
MNNILRRVLLHPFNSNSIRTMLKKSYIMILVLILIPSLLSIIISTMIINRYNRLIINVEYANSLNQIVKNDINNEIWAVVSGKKDFKDGTQYEIIEKIYTGFDV